MRCFEKKNGQWKIVFMSNLDLPGNDYASMEWEYNALGYRLLNLGKIDEAIKTFQLNVEYFPQSSNVYDSLGEAYMKKGENDLAIKNYKKSLELDPKNTNAEDMIKKMTMK